MADVKLILAFITARRMKKPQPHAGPQEVPIRKSNILLQDGDVLESGWEDWPKISPAMQVDH